MVESNSGMGDDTKQTVKKKGFEDTFARTSGQDV